MFNKAFVLAAGVGSRLRPLTDVIPKALLDFRGKRMLEHVVESLVDQGFTEIMVNVHHHPDQMKAFIDKMHFQGVSISISDESDELKDTGGALVKARDFLDGEDAFLVHNVDIYTNLDLQEFYRYHKLAGGIATLAVKDRQTSRNLLLDDEGRLCGWRNNQTGEKIIVRNTEDLTARAFSGIHILEPEIFTFLETSGPFSMTDAYLSLAEHQRIMTYDHSSDEWIDMAHKDHYPELGD